MSLVTGAGSELESLRRAVDDLVGRHSIVTDNAYTTWFARGEADLDEVRHLTVQFSVFSHLFVEAQLRKVIHAPSLDSYHAGKEILLNELGVVFRPPARQPADEAIDPDLVATE